MPRPKASGPKDSFTATIGFEATAMRDSAGSTGEAFLRSLSAAKDNLWLTADTALRDSATLRCEANLWSLSEAKNNMVASLPGQLFYSTQIPVCLWFLAKNKNADAKRGFRDHRQQTLFIDARKLGTLIDRVHRELTDAGLEKITSTYHAWRSHVVPPLGGKNAPQAVAVSDEKDASFRLKAGLHTPGFCKSATTAEIAAHGHVLTPGRYVGAEEVEDDGDPFEEKMPRLVAELHAQFAESAKLERAIRANLNSLGFKS